MQIYTYYFSKYTELRLHTAECRNIPKLNSQSRYQLIKPAIQYWAYKTLCNTKCDHIRLVFALAVL